MRSRVSPSAIFRALLTTLAAFFAVLIVLAAVRAAGWEPIEVAAFGDRFIAAGGLVPLVLFCVIWLLIRPRSRYCTSVTASTTVASLGRALPKDGARTIGYIDGVNISTWAKAHAYAGETIEDAVERLTPLWGTVKISAVSMTQRCRHEAAHAVVADAVGRTVTSVDVRDGTRLGPGGTMISTGGCVESVRPIPSQGEGQAAWTSLVTTMAGLVQDRSDGHLNGSATSDVLMAQWDAATVISAGWHLEGIDETLTVGAVIEHARACAAQLLTEHADAVAAVADALRDTPSLDGAQVRQIIRGAHND